MKIKLNRDLWNHKSEEEITVGEDHGTWAVNKGYASMCEIEPIKTKPIDLTPTNPNAPAKTSPAQNKAIEPKYKRNKI